MALKPKARLLGAGAAALLLGATIAPGPAFSAAGGDTVASNQASAFIPDFNPTPVPEPGTLMLLGAGAMFVFGPRRIARGLTRRH